MLVHGWQTPPQCCGDLKAAFTWRCLTGISSFDDVVSLNLSLWLGIKKGQIAPQRFGAYAHKGGCSDLRMDLGNDSRCPLAQPNTLNVVA